MSKYEKAERRGQDSPCDEARFWAMAQVVLRHIPAQSARILEVGCANGQLLAVLRDSGYKYVSGIDPSPVCAATARERYGLDVSPGTLSAAPIKPCSVDFLILAGVLEHVRDLRQALQRAWEMLAQGGLVFISVPNAACYEKVDDAPFQEFSVEHINFFGPQALTNLLNAIGFTRLSIEEGIMESNYVTRTPVMHAVFKKGSPNSAPNRVRDTETELGIGRYVARSLELDNRVREAVSALVQSSQPIIVWGTGTHTLRLLASSNLAKANVRAFVDSNPRYQGMHLHGVPVVPPEALVSMHEPILISSRAYQEEIALQIRNDLHLDNEVIKLY